MHIASIGIDLGKTTLLKVKCHSSADLTIFSSDFLPYIPWDTPPHQGLSLIMH